MYHRYPLLVKPIIKEKIWGGNFLKKFLKLKNKGNVGEVWFFADLKNENSIIKNGIYKGKSISDIYRKFSKAMLGKKIALKYKREFPILIKFIQAKENLSLQVHPDDKYALKNENSSGKIEAWYIIETFKNAGILLGTKQKLLPEDIDTGRKLLKKLLKYKTKKYDSFFIPAGTLHALLKGNIILEIQQNSDITYRVYDWDRKIKGMSRQLHLEKVKEVIKYDRLAGKIIKKKHIDKKNCRVNCLIKCKYFNLYEVIIEKKYKKCYNIKRPAILTIITGYLELLYKNERYKLKTGDVIFLPINILNVYFNVQSNARVILTEIK